MGSLRFRGDIEGLRAVAVLAVLLCHARMPFAEGGYVGVDVFFVISGFLITSLLIRELEASSRISLAGFWARRAKRLLPLAAVVLATIAVASALIFSPARNEVISGDIISAAFYVANWHFAAQSTDYFAAEGAISPVQHFWTLSVEEQFYLLWPGILIGCAWLARSGGRVRAWGLGAVAAICIASFLFNLRITETEPNAAYFSSLGRAWELGLGALLALAAPRIAPRSPAVGGLALVAGVTAILAATLLYNESTAFPGTAALLPVLGAAAIVWGGGAAKGPSAKVLGSAPMTYIGRISYALYLWHWPLIVFALALWPGLSTPALLGVVLLSWPLADLSHRLIENPIRFGPRLRAAPGRALALGAACMAVAAISGLALMSSVPDFSTPTAGQARGASNLKSPPRHLPVSSAITPEPTAKGSRADRGAIYEEGCLLQPEQTTSGTCVFGDPRGRRTVVLFGDSHAMHFFAAVEAVAKKRHWRVVALTKAGCPPYDVLVYNGKVGREYTECGKWKSGAFERIRKERPELVLVGGSRFYRAVGPDGRLLADTQNEEALEDGLARTLRELSDVADDVVLFRDLPKAPHDMTDCVSDNVDSLDKCAFSREDGGARIDEAAARETPGVKLIDLAPAFCRGDVCHPVVRDVLVYRDNDHMTATFARTLAPWLQRALAAKA